MKQTRNMQGRAKSTAPEKKASPKLLFKRILVLSLTALVGFKLYGYYCMLGRERGKGIHW